MSTAIPMITTQITRRFGGWTGRKLTEEGLNNLKTGLSETLGSDADLLTLENTRLVRRPRIPFLGRLIQNIKLRLASITIRRNTGKRDVCLVSEQSKKLTDKYFNKVQAQLDRAFHWISKISPHPEEVGGLRQSIHQVKLNDNQFAQVIMPKPPASEASAVS